MDIHFVNEIITGFFFGLGFSVAQLVVGLIRK